MIYFTRHKGPWVNLSLNKLSSGVEELHQHREARESDQKSRCGLPGHLRVESLVGDFLLRTRRLLKHRHTEFAKQLSLFD
jgi:hypothetical protein